MEYDFLIDIVNRLSEEAIDMLNQDNYVEYLDSISCLNESTVLFLNENDISLLYEAIGEKGLKRLLRMNITHRDRDLINFEDNISKNSLAAKHIPAISAYKSFKRGIGNMRNSSSAVLYDMKGKAFLAKKGINPNTLGNRIKFDKNGDVKPNLATHLQKNWLDKQENDQIFNKANDSRRDKKLGEKYGVKTTNKDGVFEKGNKSLTSTDYRGLSNVFGMYHNYTNQRRMKAMNRLMDYLDGKRKHVVRDSNGKAVRGKDGKMKVFYDNNDRDEKTGKVIGKAHEYTDDEYLKKNRSTLKRANAALKKMRARGSEPATDYHRLRISEKDI